MVIDMKTISRFPWFREQWKIRSADGNLLAISQPWDISGRRPYANINVMTAAPNLYQELKYAVECLENGCTPNEKWLERAKAAIMSAEGLSTKR